MMSTNKNKIPARCRSCVWYHRLTLDRLKPRTIERQLLYPVPILCLRLSLSLKCNANANVDSVHCTIFENTTRNLSTHSHSHILYISHIVRSLLRLRHRNPQYIPHVVYNSKAMINHQSRFLFCFVLCFFFFGRGNFFFTVCTSDSHLGRPQKAIAYSNSLFRCMNMYYNGRKLPILGASAKVHLP